MSNTTERRKLTPPQLARLWGINPEKVIAWIRSGELRAIDAAVRPDSQRPRYLIDVADLASFERRRAAKQRNRRKQSEVVTR